jgi:hypothetical protein
VLNDKRELGVYDSDRVRNEGFKWLSEWVKGNRYRAGYDMYEGAGEKMGH